MEHARALRRPLQSTPAKRSAASICRADQSISAAGAPGGDARATFSDGDALRQSQSNFTLLPRED